MENLKLKLLEKCAGDKKLEKIVEKCYSMELKLQKSDAYNQLKNAVLTGDKYQCECGKSLRHNDKAIEKHKKTKYHLSKTPAVVEVVADTDKP